jgi:branched-chain amino acid transport system ATP-binding protein
MLTAEGVSVAISRAQILRNVTFGIDEGATTGLIGRNGAGKTTLMRAIMGLVASQSGRIEFSDKRLAGLAADRRAALGIGYMPEDRRLVPELTVEENIPLPAWAIGAADGGRLAWIYALMPELAALAPRKALHLSGGEQKLGAMARALTCGTRLLLLDAPFEGVAPALAKRLVEVIADLKTEGLSVLLCESDHSHSAALVDRLLVIERGEAEEPTTDLPAPALRDNDKMDTDNSKETRP